MLVYTNGVRSERAREQHGRDPDRVDRREDDVRLVASGALASTAGEVAARSRPPHAHAAGRSTDRAPVARRAGARLEAVPNGEPRGGELVGAEERVPLGSAGRRGERRPAQRRVAVEDDQSAGLPLLDRPLEQRPHDALPLPGEAAARRVAFAGILDVEGDGLVDTGVVVELAARPATTDRRRDQALVEQVRGIQAVET